MMEDREIVLSVDGYKVCAAFAEERDPAVIRHVKQILLSAFVENSSSNKPAAHL